MADVPAKQDDYTKAVERASLERISLRENAFRVSADYRKHLKDADRFIDQTVHSPHFEKGLLIGTIECRVWMRKNGDKAEEGAELEGSIFSIESRYVVVFKVPGEHSAETVEAFFDRVGPFSVWPYFRTHVAHIAAEAGIDVPILPIKKLFQPVREAGGYIDPDFKGEAPELPDKTDSDA